VIIARRAHNHRELLGFLERRPSRSKFMSQSDDEPGRGSPPSAPRWVKVSAIIFAVLVLLFVILHLTGNSLGGPGSHMPPVHRP
jgi:hypothetical protein